MDPLVLLLVREGEGGMNRESSMETCTLPYVRQTPEGICCITQRAQAQCSVTTWGGDRVRGGGGGMRISVADSY